MILECEYCYSRIVIRPDDRDVKINFCPHCGEPTNEDLEELDFDYE
tara:strand:+ start:1866 stop:2003 length:138 start_codon:yes stop_codon:yes gene_type:complete